MKSISMREFLLKKEKGSLFFIDIREHYQYERGTIQGAKNIPYHLLKETPENYLLKEEVYYLFCENGFQSSRLVAFLEKKGYRVIDLEGGYEAFLKYKNMIK